MIEENIFKFKGKILAIIDWANVYGWFEKLKWKIDPQKLFNYLKNYPEIYDIRFYFGVEEGNKKSKEFKEEINKIGYTLISKKVKWVPVSLSVAHFRTSDGRIKSIVAAFGEVELYEIFKNFLAKEFQKPFDGQFCRRKCDFDCEITLDIMKNMNRFDGIVLFSGDGDYAVVVDELIKRRKQVIVVFAKGCKGREYQDFKKGLYLCSVNKIKQCVEE